MPTAPALQQARSLDCEVMSSSPSIERTSSSKLRVLPAAAHVER
jgi:hypothetical protein